MKQRRLLVYASVALCSFSTLLMELTQTRILSYVFWNHAVYLTVSLALLGFGISGTLVALFSSRGQLFTPRVLSRLWFAFGVTMFGAIAATAWLLPVLHPSRWVQLSFCYIIYVIPFVCSGAILSIMFSSAGQKMGNLYSVDLTAAGLGCVLFFVLLPFLGAPKLVCLLSVLALAMAYRWSDPTDRAWKAIPLAVISGFVIFFTVLHFKPSLLDFPTEDQKEMGMIFNSHKYPTARIEQTTWTPITRIDIIGDEHSRLLDYELPIGSYKIITQDGTAHTRLLSKHAVDFLHGKIGKGQDTYSANMVYQIRKNPEVAIIGVGGGIDVAYALGYEASSVFGIELNPATYQYVTKDYDEYAGHLMKDPRVTFINGEGRSTLRSLSRKFDTIQVIAIDTFAALSTGAYVLSENYLYTVEAFQDMFRRLKNDGILSFYRWLFHPPRETLRLSSLACEAWKRNGVTECDKRIMVIGNNAWAVSLFKNEPFTVEEVRKLASHTEEIGEFIYYWPKVFPLGTQAPMEEQYYAHVPSHVTSTGGAFNASIQAYAAGKERDFFTSYGYNIEPTTDNSPFFFEYHFLNALGLPALRDLRGDAASRTLYIMLTQATIFSLFAIFWPLWKFQRRGLTVPRAGLYSVYFAALGFAFMVIEIGVTQKSVLFLGSPLYALSVVLATLLVSAGVGGKLVAALGWDVRKTTAVAGLLFLVLMVLVTLTLTPLFRAFLHWPFLIRIAIVVLTLAPLGILMGMFFPSGLQSIGNRATAFVPWAWGINGCTSVYGSVAAILIAMVGGFNMTLAIGASIYALAFIVAQALPSEETEAVLEQPSFIVSPPAHAP